jgi:hypothetical protein
VAQDIINKIDYPTPWLHPIVVVPKKGTTDNPQPTPWEKVRNLPKGTSHFAVFYALKGYQRLKLDEESKNLTALMTPFGRYIYLRLTF